jgi:NTE family protein
MHTMTDAVEHVPVGVALSGGAARGLAHIGALAVLEEEGIPVDIIAGTSAGGIIAALYATGLSAADIRDFVASVRLLDIVERRSGGAGLLGREKTVRLLRDLFGGDIDFADLKIRLALMAADVDTGEEIAIREGSVIDGVLATTAVPGIFPPLHWNDRYVIDGGVRNPLPCDVVRAMGAERVIAVHTMGRFAPPAATPPPEAPPQSGSLLHTLLHRSRWNEVLDVFERSIGIMTEELARVRMEASPPDVTINIVLSGVTALDLSKLDMCVEAGREAARACVADLRAL